MKIIVLIILLVILGSLGQALFFLVRDKGQGDRTVRALTWRIGLSLLLFLGLMVSYWLGLIPMQPPHSQ